MEQKATERPVLEREAAPSFEELATRQGIEPVTNFDALLGDPSAEDETVDEFAAMLREWRREGAGAPHTE